MSAKRFFGWTLLCIIGAIPGCYSEGSGISNVHRQISGGAGGATSITVSDAGPRDSSVAASFACPPARSPLHELTARSAVTSSQAAQQTTMFVSDLFYQFKASCGACHVDSGLGTPPFHVSPTTFSVDMDRDDVLKAIYSDDMTKVMPPTAGPASSRNPADDPVLQLGALLKAWYAQGRPSTIFVLPQNSGDAGADGGVKNEYVLTPAVGKALTNLGNCIPSKGALYALPDQLDAFFKNATILPDRLDQTDLTTFDSAELAEHGIVAYAPTYPLWSDDAEKIRYVRVPRGQSIHFDQSTQTFDIPDNTRFYKTFLKRIVEQDGSIHYRKIETRLIVARHDVNDPTTGAAVSQSALFGTYVWNDQETEATLLKLALRNGKPFTDLLKTYVTDEGKYATISAEKIEGGATGLEETLQKAQAIRHYAVPGSNRCIQCHMGSPSQSFVLGFTPLQLNRRPLGVGGIIEEPGPDELTQLQRFIDYGIVTGLTDASDILPLEKSEGSRKPRNDYELTAQGYMVGNCAHCHNDRGYPTVTNPVLASYLNFLPGPGPIQGIFQFPLERFSPRISRDLSGAVHIPYITPSLVDFPGQADYNHTVYHELARNAQPTTGVEAEEAQNMVLAPWRSLIYRNVDTPFAYSDDLALFPHMPMNVPGFDCRLPKIMGDWMVSIPALRKNAANSETLVQSEQPSADPATFGLHSVVTADANGNTGTVVTADTNEQPYFEVKPGDTDYELAKELAQIRLNKYHSTEMAGSLSQAGGDYSRYTYCPDTRDIVDPTVTGADQAHLIPQDLLWYAEGNQTVYVPSSNVGTGLIGTYSEDGSYVPTSAKKVWPDEGVPDRPHWVVTDTTDPSGAWQPRRADWADYLVKHLHPAVLANLDVPEMLNPSKGGSPGVTLSPAVRAYAANPIPFGIWQNKSTCDFKKAHADPVSAYGPAGKPTPRWMSVAKPASTDWVYAEYPGAAIFNMICVNCHGPKADSRGRQADTLQIMTGGDARVADLRDGLLGPTTSPGTNRQGVFGSYATDAVGTDDWAARYVAWMALGGTTKLIPQPILNVVGSTPVLGVSRELPAVKDANMLSTAKTLCGNFIGRINAFGTTDEGVAAGLPAGSPPVDGGTWQADFVWNSVLQGALGSLITQNGDAELWARVCSLDNPAPVMAIKFDSDPPNPFQVEYHDASGYPAGTPVGNDRGGIDSTLNSDNLVPWCLEPSGDAALTYAQSLTTAADHKPVPLCPESLFADQNTPTHGVDVDHWALRGAANAGLLVFLYLDQVEHGYTPVPSYDQCDQL